MPRFTALSPALVFALIFGLAVPAWAESFSIQKSNYWPVTYFTLVNADTGASEVALRQSMLKAAYTFYNESLEPTAQASSRYDGVTSALFFAGGIIDVRDMTGSVIGTVRGHYYTLHSAKFTLENQHGLVLGVALLNSRVSQMIVSDPQRPMRQLARFDRQTGSGKGENAQADGWQVEVLDPDAIPPAVLRGLATYLADHQEWARWSSFNWLGAPLRPLSEASQERAANHAVDAALRAATAH